ncbi:SURF1 family protein [Roseomonas sp. SSH11]|uniref:SURF1-like protein n=1 Tax=Pararoseomonas baculiformis TaxID=2820812 RepID=A0ABS4AK62_9PROT|nr:SURF1 family cytochrome oxidase biogenesis protein [Pararoseomonas baculiformis]MBP0447420.1 SURF1 family protein [Pararoseomonas baculiformis]
MTSRWRRILPALLASIPVLAALLALGTWQVQRLHWKTDLLAQIAAAEAGPPLPLTQSPQPFTKVQVTGRFRHDLEAALGAQVQGGVLGARLVTPLEADGLPPVLVDRGWVPMERRSAPIARPDGPVTVTGYVSPPHERDFFAATDDVAGRRFFTADARAIGTALGLPGTMPGMLVALAEPGQRPGTLPQPAVTLPRPTNSHLGYAITWYGLAFSLVAVLIAWVIRKEDP